MNILVVGCGAREHAIITKIRQNNQDDRIFAAPGNPGIAMLAQCADIAVNDIDGLLDFALFNQIDLAIIGPEETLCLGISDVFQDHEIPVFGPEEKAAQLEGSKSFAKEFMKRHNIPTAQYVKTSDAQMALGYARDMISKSPARKVVLKADGLCAGKGVLVAEDIKEAEEFIYSVLRDCRFGKTELVIEEYLEGTEASLLCFVDKDTIVPMPTAKDHKTIYEAEKGPNTGGMGTYSPNAVADAYLEDMMNLVAKPFHEGLKKDGLTYSGIIFFGIMITPDGIKTLEFNVRFGDPETQSIIARLESSLRDIMLSCINNDLKNTEIRWSEKAAATVVLASEGYPADYRTGQEITFNTKQNIIGAITDEEISGKAVSDEKSGYSDYMDDRFVFHYNTRLHNDSILVNSGRVLSVTALGDTEDSASALAYELASEIGFDGKTIRRDIAPMVKRIYVSKKPHIDTLSASVRNDIEQSLNISMENLRIYQRYDIQGLDMDQINSISHNILSEPPLDDIFIQEKAFALEKDIKSSIAVKLHDGQYDQQKDGLYQSIAVALGISDVQIECARLYEIQGDFTSDQIEKIKAYLINPINEMPASMKLPSAIMRTDNNEDKDTKSTSSTEIYSEVNEETGLDNSSVEFGDSFIEGFMDMDSEALTAFYNERELAMSIEDLGFFQNYFVNEKRDPTVTELALVDTYWSDHCRHTTFNTELTDIDFILSENQVINDAVQGAYRDYLDMRSAMGYENRPQTLMDMATIMAKHMRKKGELEDVEVSDEINACSVKIKVKIDDELHDYLLMFKNETHNHPTEIEPFGGASTCLGGAIRDPLSGRSYVYQAMRVTGSSDPLQRFEDTIKGKLPQKKITQQAANGYSSYGNQIGLCTGFVDEVYHQGFAAKRMEVGAVIGAAPMGNVVRKAPESGDIIVLIGERTGRDGVGGATGSSREHDENSIHELSSQVQKGNAPAERKLQRLFRNEEAARLIKKCNDFGAGGVGVAIGELADGLEIYLDRIKTKYSGLAPFEIAISESQERMACVIAPQDVKRFRELCHQENIESAEAAVVTDENRLVMLYRNKKVADIDRKFLDSAGAKASQSVKVEIPAEMDFFDTAFIEKKSFSNKDGMKKNKNISENKRIPEDENCTQNHNDVEDILNRTLTDLNVCSKKGLIRQFDSTIGASSILLPLGGKNQSTHSQVMAALIPSLKGEVSTASVMSYGYNPHLSEKSPFHGAYYAVMDSVSRLAASGADISKARLSFQEYFEKLGTDSSKWGKPVMALLGALKAQKLLNIPAIGGKDSMSGTYKELHVPPTLISFAVSYADKEEIISNEFKKSGSNIGLIYTPVTEDGLLDEKIFKENLQMLKDLKRKGILLSCAATGHEGLLPMLAKLSFGNDIGLKLTELDHEMLFRPIFGSFIVELSEEDALVTPLGMTTDKKEIELGFIYKMNIDKLKDSYESTLEPIFPAKYSKDQLKKLNTVECSNIIADKSNQQETNKRDINKNEITSEKINSSELNLANVDESNDDSSNNMISNKKFKLNVWSGRGPKVIIPVFPGTNCEYDSAAAFERAGAECEIMVFRNLTLTDIDESIKELEEAVNRSKIMMIPGGFSLGDQPDGSGKFIAAVLRNPRISEALSNMLYKNDGLLLGVCNGFQALIKSDLLPYAGFEDQIESSATLAGNISGRHISSFIKTSTINNTSPWTHLMKKNEIYDIPVSHGEGRFIADESTIKALYEKNQIAFLYTDSKGNPSMDIEHNPNGSAGAVEGILSPCGRILGKMAHSERVKPGLYKNFGELRPQPIFESAVAYYK